MRKFTIKNMSKEKGSPREAGQVILVLILVMSVALAIGLSIVQKSLVDVSTSSKVEQSSRAFSAAEAGVEKALRGDSSSQTFTETNSSITNIIDTGLTSQSVLEVASLAKEEVVSVWLADLSSSSNPPTPFYIQNSLNIYWGNSSTDRAALELALVYYNGSAYLERKWYLDQTLRTPPNNFEQVTCGGFTLGANTYQCKYTIGGSGDAKGVLPFSTTGLMLLRVRLLYNTASQPFAVQGVGNCAAGCTLPPQTRTVVSTGAAGETQRRVKLFQLYKVVPPYFDYAVFSIGDISK